MLLSTWKRVRLCLTLAATLGGCAGETASPAITEIDSGTDARQIMRTMANTLAAAPGFLVTVHSDYDAIQADGQKITFAEQRTVQLQRPAHLRVDTVRSDGKETRLLFDGQAITAFQPQANAYVKVEKPGSVDDAVVYLVKDMQLNLPLARLLLTRLPQELDKLVTEAAYVERNTLLGVPTDHIALRSSEVDLQVWVTRTQQRLPRRVVITYKLEPGQPQFRADLDNWILNPAFSPDVFTWAPPANAERVPLLQVTGKPGGKGTTAGAKP